MPNREFELSVRFEPNIKNLIMGAKLVAEFRTKSGVDTRMGDQIELAVGEALANAIKHSRSHGDNAIGLIMNVTEDMLTVKVEDNGIGFSPEKIPPPDFEKLPSNGYGLFIIKEVMDSVSYSSNNSVNTLTMKKRLR